MYGGSLRCGFIDKALKFDYKGLYSYGILHRNMECPLLEEDKLTKRKMSFISALLLFVFLFATTPLAQDAPELKNIRLHRGETQLEVKLEITPPFNYESFTLFNPNRLVIDILRIGQFSSAPEIAVNEYGVLKIRTAKNQPDVIRVVFDLEETVPAYTLEEKSDSITILFRPEGMPVRAPEEKPEVKEPEKEPEVKEEVKPVTPPPQEKPRTTTYTQVRNKRMGISVHGGPYLVTGSDFQEIYGKSIIAFGGGMSFLFPLGDVEDIGIALDGSFISKTGQTTVTEEDVKIQFLPFTLSVFYQRDFGIVVPYAGLGLDYFSYKETLPSDWGVEDPSGSMLGYSFLLGTHIKIMPQLMAKFHVRYHVAKKTEDEIEINLSGTELAVGLTYYFDF
jgi:hypothetical protein